MVVVLDKRYNDSQNDGAIPEDRMTQYTQEPRLDGDKQKPDTPHTGRTRTQNVPQTHRAVSKAKRSLLKEACTLSNPPEHLSPHPDMPGDVIAIENLFRRWLVSRGKSRNTVLAYSQNVSLWIGYIAQTTGVVSVQALATASVSQVRSFLTHRLKKGIQKTSQAQWMASVQSFYQCLIHTGHAQECPISRLQRPRLPRRLPRPLSHENIEQLLHPPCEINGSWVEWRNHAIVVLLYATGWRIQELLNLNHVDWKPPFDHITVVGKGQKSRTTPLLPMAQKALKHAITKSPYTGISADDPLFRGEKGGRLCAGVVQRVVRQWRDSLGLPAHVTPHSLRHSFATHLLDAGAHLRHVQELLGHVSVQSTQHYVQTTMSRLQALYTASHPSVTSEESTLVTVADSDSMC